MRSVSYFWFVVRILRRCKSTSFLFVPCKYTKTNLKVRSNMIYKNKMSLAVAAVSFAIAAGNVNAIGFEAGNTKVSISGFTKLNAIYDVDNELGDVGVNQFVALDGESVPTGVLNMNARSSRIGFATSTETDSGPIKTMVEFDWADGARLRHAYGEWNGFLAGQTWTNFGRPIGMTMVLDDLPQVGVLPTRQAQIRYTTGPFSVALEDPSELGGTVIGMGGQTATSAKDSIPDVTFNYIGKFDAMLLSVGAVARQLGVDDGQNDDSKFGWGVTVQSAYRISPMFTLKAGLTHGDGIGGYIANSPVAPAYVDPQSGKVDTIEATGGTVGLELNIDSKSQFNIGYGYAKGDLDDAVSAGIFPGPAQRGAFEESSDIHVNYLYTPVHNVTYGLEVSQQSIELYDGRSGDAVRIQGSFIYKF